MSALRGYIRGLTILSGGLAQTSVLGGLRFPGGTLFRQRLLQYITCREYAVLQTPLAPMDMSRQFPQVPPGNRPDKSGRQPAFMESIRSDQKIAQCWVVVRFDVEAAEFIPMQSGRRHLAR